MEKDFWDEVDDLDPGGVLAYAPLMFKLEECGDNVEKRREVANGHLPVALLCALQDNTCLQDIKSIGDKFPEILPLIYSCATELRSNKKLKDWTKFESADYKDFIANIGKRRIL